MGRYIAKLWMPGPHDNAFERRSNLSMGVVLYTLPMLWRGDYFNYVGACASFFGVGSLAFVLNRHFRGWGHCVSHIVFGFFAHFLLHSAARVTASLHSPPEQPVYKQDGAGRSLDEWWSEAVVRWLESLW